MSFLPTIPEDAILLDRENCSHPLAAWTHHPFELDGATWPSVEHYWQGMKFTDETIRAEIRAAAHPRLVKKVAEKYRDRVRDDWTKIELVVMTRALYIKCRTHPDVAKVLLASGERMLVENSQYDYFWGCGRDQRGENHYGKLLMNVRRKLREEAAG